jgi:carbonic anhydrase
VAKGQEPFATVLACSDSRDPVELIFDRGVGDVFVVRVAGNIAGLSELATVEYGIGHLNTPVLVVMGHSKCGAVTAVAKGAELHGHLHALADKIQPAVDKAKAGNPEPDELVPRCIQANVWQTIEDIIKQSSVVRSKLAEGKLSILGAIYDLDQGKVTWLGQHPAEDSLVALAGQATTDESLSGKQDAHAKEHGGLKTSAHDASDAHGPAAPMAKAALQVKPGAHDHPVDTDAHGVSTVTKASTAQVKPRTPPSKTPPPAEPFDDPHGHAPVPGKLAGPGDHH